MKISCVYEKRKKKAKEKIEKCCNGKIIHIILKIQKKRSFIKL